MITFDQNDCGKGLSRRDLLTLELTILKRDVLVETFGDPMDFLDLQLLNILQIYEDKLSSKRCVTLF